MENRPKFPVPFNEIEKVNPSLTFAVSRSVCEDILKEPTAPVKSKGRGSGKDWIKIFFSFDRNTFVFVSVKNESKNGSKNGSRRRFFFFDSIRTFTFNCGITCFSDGIGNNAFCPRFATWYFTP